MTRSRLWDITRESFSNIWLELRVAATPAPRPQKWVFLVGCYNSGTTLLSELLGRHPEISALPTEGHFITDQFRKDYELGMPRMWAAREELFPHTELDQGPDATRIKKQWGLRLDRSKPVLLEKSPPNTPRMRWLQAHFQPAYFVAVVRNGYAVAEGITRKGDPKHLREGWPIEQSAWQWRRSNEIIEEDTPHLEHLLWSRYEDLAEDPQRELDRICQFLGISPFPAFDSSQALAIHEREQAVRNLNQSSIDALTTQQILRINEVADKCLARFGYELIQPIPE